MRGRWWSSEGDGGLQTKVMVFRGRWWSSDKGGGLQRKVVSSEGGGLERQVVVLKGRWSYSGRGGHLQRELVTCILGGARHKDMARQLLTFDGSCILPELSWLHGRFCDGRYFWTQPCTLLWGGGLFCIHAPAEEVRQAAWSARLSGSLGDSFGSFPFWSGTFSSPIDWRASLDMSRPAAHMIAGNADLNFPRTSPIRSPLTLSLIASLPEPLP